MLPTPLLLGLYGGRGAFRDKIETFVEIPLELDISSHVAGPKVR